MNWSQVAQAATPVAASIAQAAHPTPGAGASRKETATKIVMSVLQAVATTGAIPYSDAQNNRAAVAQGVEQHVAEQKAKGGVPPL